MLMLLPGYLRRVMDDAQTDLPTFTTSNLKK
jgi:hypothetical protein